MRLGEKIMTQRKLRGWSQEELAAQKAAAAEAAAETAEGSVK